MANINLWYNTYVQRILFTKRRRDQFFDNLLKKNKVSLDVLAVQYGISGRTFRDWRRGKFLPSLEILRIISRDFKIKLPPLKILPQYWYITSKNARKAALVRMALYGPPGTPNGRRKGGLISQENRRKDPVKYKAFGCIIPKTFPKSEPSKKLAELFGIILGDGSITNAQLKISLDRFADAQYIPFVARLIELTLGEKPSIINRESTTELYLSGVELVRMLEQMGLRRGSKIIHQVAVPKWITGNQEYARACLRGLFDTDGGLYIHKHGRAKYQWNNLGWCFTNRSLPLVIDVKKILITNGIEPHGNHERIFLYAFSEIRKFMEAIGSSNPKNANKYQRYIKHFYNYEWKKRKGGRVV